VCRAFPSFKGETMFKKVGIALVLFVLINAPFILFVGFIVPQFHNHDIGLLVAIVIGSVGGVTSSLTALSWLMYEKS
jgi:hypothetical protein